ncbi:MAG: hypothetical protein ABI824_04635 [Acidobacteriota bacterium]
MSDEAIKRALEAQNAITKHSRLLDVAALSVRSPMLEAVRSLHENSALKQMMADVERSQAMMRMASGPLEDLRRAGIFDHGSVLARTMADFSARFRLPEIAETARLMAQFRSSPAAEALKRYAEQTSSIQSAIENMRTPWLDVQESLRSMGGFAALQGIGHALKGMPAFGHDLEAALRVDLGDWRDTITWPPAIFTDLGARSDFYIERGFNPALTDFPAAAFEESLDIAGLRREPPPLVDLYGSPIPASNDDDEEESLARTNTAHDWLLRLETQMRRFIDQQMTNAFGPDWPKHRLPNGLYDKWQEKKQTALQNGGREWPLVAYADFTEYVLVICKRDNWSVFAPFFDRPESVRESFQRLYPVRLDTMHARPITQDDELLLYVETRRLVKVMIEKK